ncbi:MAG TPA: DUF3617 domain-containing protein [Allosphingosinicella sp.]|nr:DUF3617 domain-containing protein [Allosphingosinicella sp.]
MKQSIFLAAGAAVIFLAACNRGGPEHIQAGMWEMKAKMTQFEAPGAPAEMLGPMQAQLNREQTNRTCITQDRASNPLRQFREVMTRGQPGAACTTDEDTFTGGVIRIRVTCRSTTGQPGQGSMTMEGSFTDTTLQARMTVNADGMATGGPRSLRMTTEINGSRVGECQGAPAAPAAPAPSGNSL